MENGHEGKLTERLSGLGLIDSSSPPSVSLLRRQFDNSGGGVNLISGGANDTSNNDSLIQVMKAVEAAEEVIRQQAEENAQLRSELQRKTQELETKLEPATQRAHLIDSWNARAQEVQSAMPIENLDSKIKTTGNTSAISSSSMLVRDRDLQTNNEDPGLQTHLESRNAGTKINGILKVLPNGLAPSDNSGFSQLSSPSTRSISPSRYQMEGAYDPRLSVSGPGPMQVSEVSNPSNLWKQDISAKMREHEEEIMQLRKQLVDYSIKEAQLRNEKFGLEKRIAYLRLAFDQQQQDLFDTKSKAISYRQEIIEENIHLTYALQDAQQERTAFVSSLLPLLAEYSLQPPVPDAQSIVSNVKILFRHLQEKLIFTESKLKESQYQLIPWRSDLNHSNLAPQSPPSSIGAVLANPFQEKNGLELVPQMTYSQGKIPMASSDAQSGTTWNVRGHHQIGISGAGAKNLEPDDVGRFSPLASRNPAVHEVNTVARGDAHAMRYVEGTTGKQVIFREPVSNSEMDDPEAEGNHERERGTGTAPYSAAVDDPNLSYSPYLPPVLEEPSSSFSEDDDPLPAIEGLQISGEAFPGRVLQASGYSINGTTSCNFEWVRHLEDGSVNYIDGAKQPNYLVTADDVDHCLAIEVQPLDDRKRKGELVRVFANEHRKISCDPEMQNHIERTLYSGHVSYKVSLSTGYLDIWEAATLAIKREGFSIKCSGTSGLVVTEKFSPAISVTIPHGQPNEFIIAISSDDVHLLRTENKSNVTCSRDTIVLIMRLFLIRASERRKGKRRGLFFTK
ncbi:hypothetical protein K2173_000980 [Erythroxylum novogranatense]|uniref:Uncharacterized protein n=1 Tax=Erythroxylum novogranatense TaxID=1862640 RepID=A0AAV8TSH5_9ROSI|nr:hypothetical protein K2173_000980 [Erythroxylum novogranatense]